MTNRIITKKMNILVHSHLFPSSYNPQLGTFVYFYVKSLCELGHQVTVVAPVPYVLPIISKKNSWYQYKFVPSESNSDGFKVFYPRFFSIPKKKLLSLRGDLQYYSARSFYKKLVLTNKFDFIHCHVVLPDGIVGSFLHKKYKIPYGVTINGADLLISAHMNKLCYSKIKNNIEKASFVGLVSERLKMLMLDYKISPNCDTTQVIYNGVNIVSSKPEVCWDDKCGNAFRLLSVGHALKQKGIEYVLKALAILQKKHKNLVYYVIGDGIDLPYFKRVAQSEGVSDITYFLGRKPNDEVQAYMQAADVFILPSWNEAFGVVYIEAMAANTPIVATRGEGIAELISQGENGLLVDAKSTNSIVQAIDRLIKNPELRKKLARNGRKVVQDKLTWENNARAYIGLMSSILSKAQ